MLYQGSKVLSLQSLYLGNMINDDSRYSNAAKPTCMSLISGHGSRYELNPEYG